MAIYWILGFWIVSAVIFAIAVAMAMKNATRHPDDIEYLKRQAKEEK